MKRKRGNKKNKRKGAIAAPAKESVSLITEVTSDLEELDDDSPMEVDTPSTDHHNVVNIKPEGLIDKIAGKSSSSSPVGRVKVKLRTSKIMDTQLNSSDAPTQSDTDKSSMQMGFEKQGMTSEKMEDSANSLPGKETVVSGTPLKKPGSIKIKSSKSLEAGNNMTGNALKAHDGNRMPRQDSRFNKKELDSALTVIKKVMKMDAAEPFNAPVNPVALGIPDYFDVIDTPMDFGTICSNLENGGKYMNSEDVFKDVQYIWGNCYKYNNKGDYILDLMRRVKKNFMKYWAAAGLYNGQGASTNGNESFQDDGQAKQPLKGSKQKSKKRHGRRHKSDCLCAICVLKRRRKEREEIARIAKDQTGVANNSSQELKPEESLQVESVCSEDSSSHAGDSGENDLDVEAGEVEGEVEVEVEVNDDGEVEGEEGDEMKVDVSKQQSEEDGEENEMETKMESNGDDEQSPDMKVEETIDLDQSDQEQIIKEQRKKVNLNIKNPLLLELCGTLFPVKARTTSVWRGPHSLLNHHKTCNTTISAAIDKFMK